PPGADPSEEQPSVGELRILRESLFEQRDRLVGVAPDEPGLGEAGTDGSGRGGVACERLLERALRLARAFQAEIRPAARRAYPRLDLRRPVSRFDHVEKLAEPLLLGEELGEREGGLSVVLLILVGDAKLPLRVVELAEPAQRDPEPKMRLPAVGILLEGVPRVNE